MAEPIPLVSRYVYIALVGAWALPLLVIWIVSLIIVRRRRDPARLAFLWLKILIPFAVIYAVIVILYSAARIVLYKRYYLTLGYALTGSQEDALQGISDRGPDIGALFEKIACALILVTFVELGNGFMYARTHTRTTYQRVFRYFYLFLAVIFFALALALVVQSNRLTDSGPDELGQDEYYRQVDILFSIDSAHTVMYWIFLLPTIAYAAVSVHFWKRRPSARGIAIQFLVATILMFIRCTYDLAYFATYVIGKPIGSVSPPSDLQFVTPVLYTQPLYITIILLFAIGIRKENGLWTTQQPFHGGAVHGRVVQHGYAQPVGYIYPAPAHAPPGWQPQQPQPHAPPGWQPQQPQPARQEK